jgi:uncharacterized membrane protein (UPF0127 family)
MQGIKTSWLFIFLGFALLAIMLFVPIQFNPNKDQPISDEGTVWIKRTSGEELARFTVEVADTDEKREAGLMGRRKLNANEGMFFVMEEEEIHSFWMVDTYLSLDIIFINAAGEIVFIAKELDPELQEPVNSKAPSLYALEVLGGRSEALGLRVGDLAEWELRK